MNRIAGMFAFLAVGIGVASLDCGGSKTPNNPPLSLTSSGSTGGAAGTGSSTTSGGMGGMGGGGGAGGQTASSSSGTAGGGGAGGSGCSAAAQCGAPEACGPWATVEQIAMDPPAPTSGPIAEGTYELSAHNVYTGPGGASGPFGDKRQSRLTLAMSAGAYLLTNASISQSAPLSIVVQGGSYAVSAGMLALNGTCPSAAALSLAYTATGSTLSLRVPNGTTLDELVLAKK